MIKSPLKRQFESIQQTNIKKSKQNEILIMDEQNEKEFNLHEYYMNMKNNKYKSEDLGPFNVYIFDQDPTKCLGNLHEMSVAREFRKLNKVIQRIKKIDKFKIMICCISALEANKLVESEITKINREWVAVIPDNNVKSIGIIGDIPVNIDDKYILESIQQSDPQNKIFAVERVKKRDPDQDKTPDGKIKLIPTEMIKIFVHGTSLPNCIIIDNVERRVRHFYPKVKRCSKCLRFGHYQNICRGVIRCGKCSGPHKMEECTNNVLHCIHCQSSNHDSISMICPQYLKEKKINKVRQEKRISYKEAKALVDNLNKQKKDDMEIGSRIEIYSNNGDSDNSSNSTVTTVETVRHEIPQGHVLLDLNKSFMIEINKFTQILMEIVGNDENIIRIIKMAEDRYKNLTK